MPTLHKNITASADIHNPKWFPDANNGDVAWRNEKGELESTDELVLPAALNFVDASVAPPTTNDGDIYVLSSGGSVNAGWGAVSLDDWVRYDLANTTWNSITPNKSVVCYDKTADVLMSYDGADWSQVGGDSIYTASGTVPTSVVSTLTDTLTFDGGTVNIQGADTVGTNSALEIFDGDTTPSSLWDFRNNGDVYLGKDSDFNLASNLLSFTTTGTSEYDAITTNTYNGSYVKYKNRGGVVIKSQSSNNAITVRNTGDTLDTFEVFSNGGGDWDCVNSDIRLGNFTNNDYVNIDNNGLFGIIGGVTHHEIGLLNTNAWTVFFKQGFTANSYFIIGGSAPVSYAKISLLDDTLMGNTGDKVGFMGTAPIVQVTTGVAAATFTANTSLIANDTATFDGYTIGQVVKALRNYGLLA